MKEITAHPSFSPWRPRATACFAALGLAALCSVPNPGRAQTTANVTVDTATALRVVDTRVFGLNTAEWDPLLNTTNNSASISLLDTLGTHALRYPGGGTSDDYTWTQSDTDNFAAVATATDAQVFITVNYGSGTPAEAAAWVQYANETKNYGFKYWEVGNECYGTWETDDNTPAHDPKEYATRFIQYYQAMKAVDSTIKIGAVSPTTTEGAYATSYNYLSEEVTNPQTGQPDMTWTGIMLYYLKAGGVMPDFLICHRYEQNAGSESDAGLLQAADSAQTGWAADATLLRTALNDYYGSAAASVKLCVTENNSVHNNPGKQTVSLVNGLYLADSFGNLLQTEFSSMLWWAFRNGPNTTGNDSSTLYGWRTDFGDYGVVASQASSPADYPAANTPFPTYYVYELLSHFAQGGDTVVSASSSQSLLSAFAVERQDGTLTLLVVNKDPSNTDTANVTINGYTPAANGLIWSYGIPQDSAADPNSPDYNLDNVGVASSTLANAGGTFSATFAPYSVSVLAMSPANLIITPPESQTVNSGSTVVLTVQAAGSPNFQWQYSSDNGATWTDVTDNGSTIFGATTSQLIITGATPANAGLYQVVVSNSVTSTTSASAALTVESGANAGTLAALSTRADVGTGADLLIGGFVIGGSTSRTVLILAVGPGLQNSFSNYLHAPTLTLISNGQAIYSNTGWDTGGNGPLLQAEASLVSGTTLTPGVEDSALLATLPPGAYTAEVTGANGSTGIAVVSIYQLP